MLSGGPTFWAFVRNIVRENAACPEQVVLTASVLHSTIHTDISSAIFEIFAEHEEEQCRVVLIPGAVPTTHLERSDV